MVFAAVLLSGWWASGPTASAEDNVVVASEPRSRQELTAAPGWVTIALDGDVDPTLAKMLVQDSGGRNVTTGELIVEGTNVTSQLIEGLAEDTYTVTYRTARADGQPAGGSFQFSYGKGTFSDALERTWSGTEAEPSVLKNPDPNAVTTAPVTEPPSPRVTTSPAPTPPGSSPSTPTTASPSSTGTPSSTAGPSSGPGSDGGLSPTVFVIGAVLVSLVILAAVLITRRQRRAGPS